MPCHPCLERQRRRGMCGCRKPLDGCVRCTKWGTLPPIKARSGPASIQRKETIGEPHTAAFACSERSLPNELDPGCRTARVHGRSLKPVPRREVETKDGPDAGQCWWKGCSRGKCCSFGSEAHASLRFSGPAFMHPPRQANLCQATALTEQERNLIRPRP